MNIGFLGAGKVGFTLGKVFSDAGLPVTGYFSRHRESADEAAEFTHTKSYPSVSALLAESDTILFTVPDDALADVYRTVSAHDLTGKQLIHCSGAKTASSVFTGESIPYSAGSLHPLFPISDRYLSYRELPGAFFCLEGDEIFCRQWDKILQDLGCHAFTVPEEKKTQYHAACSMASNLVCGLIRGSFDLLTGCGLTEEEAKQAVWPLAKTNLEHCFREGPTDALTGPVERGDVETVAAHINTIPDPTDNLVYRTVSLKLAEMAEVRHPDRDYSEIHRTLDKESDS